MFNMINTVVAGDYKGCIVSEVLDIVTVGSVQVTKKTVESCKVVNDSNFMAKGDGILWSVAGGALFGPVGLVAGGLAALNVKTYMLEINWKNGKRSLMEVSENMYKSIMKAIF